MNEFDLILEECVDLIASGESSPEECLNLYPEYAAQLEPILYTTVCLQEEGREVIPPSHLRARIRGELNQAMKNNPQKKSRFPVFFWRMVLNVSMLVFAMVMTNTLFAQEALPGESLYNWKLASEDVWRAVTVDPLGTDLKLSDRRVNEYVAVSSDERRRTEVLVGYNKLLVRFKDEQNEGDWSRISSVLRSQQDSLHKVGLSIPALERYFSGAGGDAPDPPAP
jgi:hypothetical protein